MSKFSITTAHHDLPSVVAKRLVGSMVGSLNFRAVAYMRMAMRQDAYEAKQAESQRGYAQYSDEPNLDKRAEADIGNAEVKQKEEVSKDFGFNSIMPARELAMHMMTLRGFFTGRIEVMGVSNRREEPQSIDDTLEYMLSLDPIRDRENLKLMCEACELDFELMETSVIADHARDVIELAKNIGKIKGALKMLQCDDVEEATAEDCFDQLPAHIRHKLVAKIITTYERLAKAEMVAMYKRGTFDSATNYKLLKAKRIEAVAWLKEFSVKHKIALREYVERGGDLMEFDSDIVTSNEPVARASNPSLEAANEAARMRAQEDLEAAAAAKKEHLAKMQRAPAPVKPPMPVATLGK